MNIGEAARASGVNQKMIRYYESIGLVPAAKRSENGYRVYTESDVHTLAFVRRARNLGFSIEKIQVLMALWRDRARSSAEVKAIAQDHITELQAKIEELDAMRRTLEHLAANCHGDERPECPIIEDLSGSPVPPAEPKAAGRKDTKQPARPSA